MPVPLLSKDEMKINMTKAKISIVQKNDSPLGMAKSSNVIGQPLLKKPSSLNQTYTGASNNQSFSNNANLFNTKTSSVEHTPYVLSSGYKADDKSHYSA